MVSGMFTWLRTPLWRPLRRFWMDGHGVSAVEFALIVPILLSLYFGAVEVGQALIINRKVRSGMPRLTVSSTLNGVSDTASQTRRA